MSPPGHHPLVNELVVTMQEEKTDIRRRGRQDVWVGGGSEGFGAMEEDLSVLAFQGRAGH